MFKEKFGLLVVFTFGCCFLALANGVAADETYCNRFNFRRNQSFHKIDDHDGIVMVKGLKVAYSQTLSYANYSKKEISDFELTCLKYRNMLSTTITTTHDRLMMMYFDFQNLTPTIYSNIRYLNISFEGSFPAIPIQELFYMDKKMANDLHVLHGNYLNKSYEADFFTPSPASSNCGFIDLLLTVLDSPNLTNAEKGFIKQFIDVLKAEFPRLDSPKDRLNFLSSKFVEAIDLSYGYYQTFTSIKFHSGIEFLDFIIWPCQE